MYRAGTLLLILIALAAGCADSPAGKQVNELCSTNADCADRVCHSGLCAAVNPGPRGTPCKGHGECRSYNCTNGVCLKGKAQAGASCIYDEECLAGSCGPAGTCAGAGPDGGGPDAPRADLARPDLQSPDLPRPDAPRPDAPRPDAPTPDAQLPDLPPPDLQPKPDATLCGNSKLDATEICDGALLGGKTCKTQGYTSGVLACAKTCKLDTAMCYTVAAPLKLDTSGKGCLAVGYPDVAFGDANYLVAWRGSTTGCQPPTVIYGRRLGLDGKVLDPKAVQYSFAGKEGHPDVGYDGTRYLLVWDTGSPYAAVTGTRVSKAGLALDPFGIGATIPKLPTGSSPAVAYSGVHQLLAATTGPWVHRVSPLGKILDQTPLAVSSAGTAPALARGPGSQVLLAWQEKGDILGRVLDQQGKLVGNGKLSVAVASQLQQEVAVASNGATWLAAWTDNRAGGNDIAGTVISANGKVLHGGSASLALGQTLAADHSPALASDGNRYLLVWCAKSVTADLMAVLLDAQGKQLSSIITVAKGVTTASHPAVAYGAQQFVIAWGNYHGSIGRDIRVTRLKFGSPL